MRVMISLAVLALPLVAGCATSDGPNRYQAEMDRLEAQCTERGGILQPTGSQSGEPARDYACRITGGASRLN
ncbi:hypothetical protein [Brevundimonas sp.]|uniref:hypothetical protein n=1 Tax=Brevundimonas sp. TaxID=1871086 RepID=UPI0019CE4C95|nr:hypothetical protein [Brevundimonas sp.]MBD3837798.1 hypothetical protein [Brevundimonas sp.]